MTTFTVDTTIFYEREATASFEIEADNLDDAIKNAKEKLKSLGEFNNEITIEDVDAWFNVQGHFDIYEGDDPDEIEDDGEHIEFELK